MAVNRLTRHLNVNAGRLLDEYNVKYESLTRHEGRRIRLTGAVIVGENKISTRTGAQPKEWPDLLVGLF